MQLPSDMRQWIDAVSALTEVSPIVLMEQEQDTARLERARQMGFDTEQVFYHATTANFRQFDLSHAGRSNTIGQGEPAIFLTDDSGTANSYIPTQYVAGYQDGWTRETFDAAEAKMQDLFQQAQKPLSAAQGPVAQQFAVRRKAEAEANAILSDLRAARQQPKPVHQTGSNIIPVFIKTKRLMKLDMRGAQYDPDMVTRYLRKAKRAKKDGVMFSNFYDWGDAPGTLSRPRTTVAIFDPKNIRSVFANFDPAKADSATLTEKL